MAWKRPPIATTNHPASQRGQRGRIQDSHFRLFRRIRPCLRSRDRHRDPGGSNQFHGSLYEFFRPNVTAARTFFAPSPSPLKQHNFGGTTGGPVRKNKTFFFASYEEERIRTAYSFLDSVPPANQIRYLPGGGVDLSGLKDPFTGNQVPDFRPNFYAANYYRSVPR